MYFKVEVEVPVLNLTTFKDEPRILNAETYAETEEEARQEIREFYSEDMGIPMEQVKILSITSVEAD